MRFQVSKGHLALLTKLGKSPLKESPVKLEVKERSWTGQSSRVACLFRGGFYGMISLDCTLILHNPTCPAVTAG
jgi:hypothetical protein